MIAMTPNTNPPYGGRNTSATTPPIGKGTGLTGDPHFALGTSVKSPESRRVGTRTCNEWPDGESSSRNAQRAYQNFHQGRSAEVALPRKGNAVSVMVFPFIVRPSLVMIVPVPVNNRCDWCLFEMKMSMYASSR